MYGVVGREAIAIIDVVKGTLDLLDISRGTDYRVADLRHSIGEALLGKDFLVYVCGNAMLGGVEHHGRHSCHLRAI